MSRRKHILGFGLLLAAATTVPAYAQAPSSSPTLVSDFPVCTKTTISVGDSDLAKQKFIAARQDYEEGNYDSALRRFKDAYILDCTKPELLLIVSATYERKGDRASAVAALEAYVQRVPKDAPDVPTTQAKIDNLKKQIAAAPPPTPTSSGTTASSDVQEHTIYPWLVVGLGGALVVGGVITLLTSSVPTNCSRSSGKCMLKAGETQDELASDRSDAGNARGQTTAGIAIAAGGGAVLIGGLVWHFLEPTGPKEKTALAPAVGPGFAGLTFNTKF